MKLEMKMDSFSFKDITCLGLELFHIYYIVTVYVSYKKLKINFPLLIPNSNHFGEFYCHCT